MNTYDFRMILAIGIDGTIGNGSVLPWKYEPKDMDRFKNLTQGKTVLMGRNTWESLPPMYRPLPNRKNIVLTSNPDSVVGMRGDNNHIITSMDGLDDCLDAGDTVFIIGGASLYDSMIEKASIVHLTIFHRDFDGDVSISDDTFHYIDNSMSIVDGSCSIYTSEHGYDVEFMDLVR